MKLEEAGAFTGTVAGFAGYDAIDLGDFVAGDQATIGYTANTDNSGGMLTLGDPSARRHQFLVSLERQHDLGSFTLDTGFVSMPDAQRERGEVAIEGVGTLELSANGRGAASPAPGTRSPS